LLNSIMAAKRKTAAKKKNPPLTAKVVPPRKVVRAVKVEDRFASCTCGEKIKLEPRGPVLKSSRGVHFPVLVAVICPKCGAEVRLDSDDLTETSAVLRKSLRAPPAKKRAH
jgi:hypothetical protein